MDDLLDRGDLGDWAPLVRALDRDPSGLLAERVLHRCSSHRMYGTSPLWIRYITQLRE